MDGLQEVVWWHGVAERIEEARKAFFFFFLKEHIHTEREVNKNKKN